MTQTRGMHVHSPNQHDVTGTEFLRLARGSIEYGLIHKEPIPINCDELPRALTEPGATFTTFEAQGGECRARFRQRRRQVVAVDRQGFAVDDPVPD